ncbi:small integral membrane protein 13 isoform X2 [Tympanuchus pallidicinctus]|uniref:small integral membrane protein 13 isoform X2 n=1 Tax=Tympanuchus pallidicinctus TaxID=109042 RepID=UPI002287639C|nr:small integral membrane protein 13 isoform X2 [Tympanuchus pallidicinctus]
MKTQVEKYLSYTLCQDSDQVKTPSVSKVTVIVMKMQWPVLKNGGSIPREERSQHQGRDASLYNRLVCGLAIVFV